MQYETLENGLDFFFISFQHSTQHIVGIQYMNVMWILSHKVFNVFEVNIS